MTRVNARIYDALIRVSGQAARLEQKMYDACKEGIVAAAEADSPLEFDSTVGYLEDVFRQRGQTVPFAIKSMKVVIHDALERQIPLLDEYGNPRPLNMLRAALDNNEAPKKRRRVAKKKAARVRRETK